MRRLDRLVDTRPLRAHPAFRRLWIGTVAAGLGGQIATVAVLYQVWQLTGSTVWTGAIGIATAVPMVVAGLLGGTLADLFDRRRIVLAATVGAVVAALCLAAQSAAGGTPVLLVLALVAAQTTGIALGSAARRTFIARLLPAELVPAGVAITHLSFQIAMLIGPATAGAILATGGLPTAYLLDAAAGTVALYGVLRLPAMRPFGAGETSGRRPAGLRATWDGWRFLVSHPTLRGCLATDLAATVLAMPIALFPAVNAHRFDGSGATLGLFFSAIAVGGLLAGLSSGAVTRARRPGTVMLLAAATWGATLAAFGMVSSLTATLLCLALAGAADTVAVIARGTIVQLTTPDAYLGRVSAAENVAGAAGPGLGNARAGAVAGLTSAGTAALTGGIGALLVIAVIAASSPGLRRWTADTDPNGARLKT